MRNAAVLVGLVLFSVSAALRAGEPPVAPKLVAKPDAFQTLVNPNCSHCIDEAKRRSKELRDDDRVLVWTRGKYDGGAIPIRFFLNTYRVISDSYGTFVYDPDAGYARGFPASYDYRFHGWRNGVMVMKHKDGTLFSCLSGIAFDGPRKGEKLEFWPTVEANWGWYVKHYPGGVAYHMYDKYVPVEVPAKPNEDSLKSRGKADPRYPPEQMVLGIDRKDKPVAFPLAMLECLGPFAVGNENSDPKSPVVVLWQSSIRSAAAYLPTAAKHKPPTKLGVEGEIEATKTGLEIVADGKSADAPFLDTKTGSRFDICGRCTEGELKGYTLVPVPAVMCKWFAWAAEFPNTAIYGK
ncbi:MAG TPA: DUF3179 domain-containing (seleno)protein [Gemmataceae bacterium]|nr:DUF3179 domain-containing (seleno)protein [Gemmataceae bacterium]